jgi:hypothetical protein
LRGIYFMQSRQVCKADKQFFCALFALPLRLWVKTLYLKPL